jgi:DNA-directed RNA polymerase subunit RPC12/RpoP
MLERIICRGCGRSFLSERATELLAAITGRCPDCGSQFAIANDQPPVGSSARLA